MALNLKIENIVLFFIFFCYLPKSGVLKTLSLILRVCGVWTFKRRSSLIHIFAKLSLIGWPTNQNLKQSSRFLPVEAYYLHNGKGGWKNNFIHKEPNNNEILLLKSCMFVIDHLETFETSLLSKMGIFIY